MTIKQFKEKYDKPGAVVLLEGKRKVLDTDKEKLVELGRKLAAETEHIIFRSGNADGSDQLFMSGVVSVAPERTEAIAPYAGHRKSFNKAARTYNLDEIDVAAETELISATKLNKRIADITDLYASGVRNKNTIKAAYILRDTVKVLGTRNIPPATFGLFYEDLANPGDGGTGHTIMICNARNIPVINQKIWFNWI